MVVNSLMPLENVAGFAHWKNGAFVDFAPFYINGLRLGFAQDLGAVNRVGDFGLALGCLVQGYAFNSTSSNGTSTQLMWFWV